MRYSRLFIPTLKEAPAEAEAVSHKLMVRAGYVRQLAAGLYIYLPLGIRVMEKINRIIREEMNAIGACLAFAARLSSVHRILPLAQPIQCYGLAAFQTIPGPHED